MAFLDRFFSQSYEKELKEIKPLVAHIATFESAFADLPDVELTQCSHQLKIRISGGETLEAVLPEAYALVREVAKRVLGVRYYDVQMIGGIILHRGRIAEMRTGEGKTFVGTLPSFLNALTGRGIHVVTVNDYLARRDAVWVGGVYALLGLSVGIINQGDSYLYDGTHKKAEAETDPNTGAFKVVYDYLRPCARKEAYAADITYGTNNEYGFDYLRDNIEFTTDNLRQREPNYAIIDEVDSILIDEARTPLIISAPAQDSENLYDIFAKIAARLKLGHSFWGRRKITQRHPNRRRYWSGRENDGH